MSELSPAAQEMLRQAELAIQLPLDAMDGNATEDYFVRTLPTEPKNYVGIEHLKYLTQDYELGEKSIATAFRGMLVGVKKPNCIERPDKFYTPENAHALSDFVKLRAKPWPKEGVIVRFDPHRTTTSSNWYKESTRQPVDYMLRAGFIINKAPAYVERVLRKEVKGVGRVAAAAMCQAAVSLSEYLERVQTPDTSA